LSWKKRAQQAKTAMKCPRMKAPEVNTRALNYKIFSWDADTTLLPKAKKNPEVFAGF
jgi:hypothetical protein